MNNNIEEFFKLFCKFVKTDLIKSFEKGRNFKIIYNFVFTFYVITHKNIEHSKKKKAIEKLKIIVNEYLSENSSKIKLNCDDINNEIIFSLNGVFESLNKYFNSIEFFRNHQNDKQIFRQGMVEGYNALVHILKGLNEGKTTLDNNLLKASNHFHRGALDYYKALIRENFSKIDKEEFKKLRVKEYESIGLETNKNETKKNIINEYEEKVKKIIK